MIVNQANLHGLTVGYSTAFNKSFDTTQGVLKGQYERMVMGCRQSGQRCPEILMSCSNA